MRAMHVGRQSMYDTFGDKRALFLKALEMYVTESVHAMAEQIQHTLYQVSTATALAALVEGIYQGAVQVAALREHGDLAY